MTWADICTLALRRLGYLQPAETPSADDAAHVFQTLQVLINGLGTERGTMYEVRRSTWTIVSGTGTYTVGSGGTVNIARPVFVQNVNYIDTSQDPDLEMPLGLLTDDAYQAIPQKSLTAVYPSYAYYNPTYGDTALATLTFWQIPTSTTLLGAIYAPVAVVEPSSSSASISLPPGYERYLRDTLAIEVAPDFAAVVTPDLLESARIATANIKRANIREADLYVDAALSPRFPKANIYSGNVG